MQWGWRLDTATQTRPAGPWTKASGDEWVKLNVPFSLDESLLQALRKKEKKPSSAHLSPSDDLISTISLFNATKIPDFSGGYESLSFKSIRATQRSEVSTPGPPRLQQWHWSNGWATHDPEEKLPGRLIVLQHWIKVEARHPEHFHSRHRSSTVLLQRLPRLVLDDLTGSGTHLHSN